MMADMLENSLEFPSQSTGKGFLGRLSLESKYGVIVMGKLALGQFFQVSQHIQNLRSETGTMGEKAK